MADERLRWGRGLAVGISILLGLVLVVAIAVFVLTGTDWGHERVRRIAQNAVSGMVHGKVKIGPVSGNLLTGMTVHDVAITDSSGAPFIALESFKGNYSVMSLLRKHIWIQDVVLVRPLIVLDRPPNGEWNYQTIFKRDTTPKPANQAPSWGDWIRFSNAKVVGGQLIVRTPWKPSSGLSAAARDSAIEEAVSGKSRLVIQQVPGGFQKTVQLDSVSGTFPLVRLAEPGMKTRLVQVSTMAMNAYPFRPPGAEVRDVKGAFAFDNDSAWWKGAYVELPQSKATGDGVYALSSGDLRMMIHSDPASFSDMRWIYPALPANGRGSVDFQMTWKGAVQDYYATKTDLTIGNARISGSAGATLGDTLTVHDTDLRFSGVDTRLLEQVIPHFKSPRRGVLAGHATARGGRNALVLNADATFDDQRAGRNRLIANGEVGMFPGGMRARDLRLQFLPVQVELARTWMPSLPIGGTVTGSATLNGATTTQLAFSGKLDHNDRGAHSAVDGKGTIRLTGGKYFDVDVNARPVSLVEVGRFAPAVGLQGTAAGPLHLTGALKNLRVTADLTLPDGGRFTTRGTLDLASKEKGYDLVSSLHTVNLRTVNTKAPVTSLTANAAVRGRGFQLATMNAAVAADMSASRLDTISFDTLSVRASAANGLANVEKLYVLGSHVAANVHGTLGLVKGKNGTMAYAVGVDSLGALNRFIRHTPGDSVAIPPRPGVVARALRQARADSARIAERTEIERLATGRPGPKLNADVPSAVPGDTLMGAVKAAGTLTGNIDDFSLHGTASGEHIIARGNSIRAFDSYYRWDNARTPAAKLSVGLEAGTVSAMGFALDTVSVRGTYATTGGRVELAVGQGKTRQLSAMGDYVLNTGRQELRLGSLRFQFDTSLWMAPHATAVRWGGPGIQVDTFELRNRSGGGRIYANGLLPTEGVADFRLAVDSFPVGDIVSLTEVDVDMTGIISVHGTMGGTTNTPAFRGDFGLTKGVYNGTPVPDLVGRFGYADRQLVTHVDATRNNAQPMMTIDARVPINLALSGATGSRMLPDPMSVDLNADSLPLELVPQFTDVISNFHGRAYGRVAMRGTLKRPSLVGQLALNNGTVMLNSTGATFDHMTASIRMANDTVYVDSVAAKAVGDVHLRGTLAVGDWREPAFNLYLTSSGGELMNNIHGKVRVDAGLALTGPFTNAYLSGGARIAQGVIYAPEPTGRHLVGAGDPELFNVLDTALTTERDLFPAASPMLRNLRVDMELSVKRNTWVRNREANVEIYTDDPVAIRAEQQAFALTGIINTDRGEYNFLSKRFQIKRGSIMFVGSPDLNPTLQITGEYQVQTTRTLNISVLIGGTLKRPKLALESDAQPPKTQSELLSLLAFGQPTSSLLAFGSSSVAGSAATGDLFGTSAQYATQRLASVAVGVIVDQIELQAGRAFGTDVLDITPGDVPVFKGSSAVGTFFTGTRIEAGKYINGRTFVGIQEQGGQPGASIEHRTADGWRFNASIAPRIILREPTLTGQPIRTTRSYGGFIIREWRF